MDSNINKLDENKTVAREELSAEEFKRILKALGKDTSNEKDASLDNENKEVQSELESLKQEVNALKVQKQQLEEEIALARRTSDQINRLALKEASKLISKAKKNADMILRESMEYVSGLTHNIEDYKQEAINFRANVAKLSDDVLKAIDSSDLFELIKEENAEKETD